MKKMALFLGVLLLFCLVVGCSSNAGDDANLPIPTETPQETSNEILLPTPSPSIEPEQTPELPPQTPHPITSSEGTESLLLSYDSFVEFADPRADSAQPDINPTVIATSSTVSMFRYIEILFTHDDYVRLYDAGTLYTLDYLTPETPFVVHGIPWSTIPQRGISFVDESGIARYFTVSLSGYDGAIVLVEFWNPED
ncbi:MAG: hypothetical protein FWE06_01565 [Oscillospiraceae bacterium]|nr:hypothetical protein [Oscillospiraceae bacterium]